MLLFLLLVKKGGLFIFFNNQQKKENQTIVGNESEHGHDIILKAFLFSCCFNVYIYF